MAALAEVLVARGARVTGSDIPETFYTDKILSDMGVPVAESFDPRNISPDVSLVVRSAAYGNDNVEVLAARDQSLPVITYPEALGALSQLSDSSAVAGVHGKTTTTAMAGILAREVGLPASVLVGSAVAGFGDRSTWTGGNRYFIAETCEYRRHFLNFHPRRILLTGVESDHQDFFPDYPSIRDAFFEFAERLPDDGALIFAVDDEGAREVAEHLRRSRPAVRRIPYGEEADGEWKVSYGEPAPGRNAFTLAAFPEEFTLRVPGRHLALDAAGATALIDDLVRESGNPDGIESEVVARAWDSFTGSRRRSEIVGEADGALVMDDYGHHPTAIRATLRGLKEFHPQRRLVVDFMPHTFSRTAALLEEFTTAFDDADVLVLHGIYASAREEFNGTITGLDLYEKVSSRRTGRTVYYETVEEALPWLIGEIRRGDLFLTLGAGNNWPLGRALIEEREVHG